MNVVIGTVLVHKESGRRPPPKHLLLTIVSLIGVQAFATVWYVDKANTSGPEDGTSWERAFTAIQPAIDAAFSHGGGEVWVAGGVYDERRISIRYTPPTDMGSLLMRSAVHIYGGFKDRELERHERDWQLNPTVIDGSVARNGQSAYHVIVGADNATLDGFIVSGAQGNLQNEDPTVTQTGAGMLTHSRHTTYIVNCTFRRNAMGLAFGGGLYNVSSSPTIVNCVFEDNTGCGIYNAAGFTFPKIIGCRFTRNSRGGIYNGGGASPTVRNCVFAYNTGTAITQKAGILYIENCVFWRNSSRWYAGGIAVFGEATGAFGYWTASIGVRNCTFVENTAGAGGGAVYSDYSSSWMSNCIVWNNSPPAVALVNVNEFRVRYTNIQGGFSGTGNMDQDPLFVDAANGDFRLLAESPCIDSGTSTYAPVADIAGAVRPQGLGYDMGAYESPYSRADVDGDGSVDAADVQLVINAALGLTSTPNCDVNRDGGINATDVQLVINAALGL